MVESASYILVLPDISYSRNIMRILASRQHTTKSFMGNIELGPLCTRIYHVPALLSIPDLAPYT